MRRRLFSTTPKVFDSALKERQREWAVSLKDSTDYDYLRKEVAERIVDRLDDIVRDFPNALDIGCHRGYIHDAMVEKNEFVEEGGRPIGGVTKLTQADLPCFQPLVESKKDSNMFKIETRFKEISQEETMGQFGSEEFDIVISSLWMHWVNDIPSFLKGARRILKPDGAFICSVIGGNTLEEFRHSFYLAELERKGGIAPHASPMLRASDAASLLQQAQFSLPTIDVDTITVVYPNSFVLMEHLAKMGEGSASFNRQYNVGKESFLAMSAIYQELYGEEDGSIPVTYQVISMIGWNPHKSQPTPLRRGSAAKSLKDIAEPVIVNKSTDCV